MKKLLALLMVFVMLFAFAACGGNGEEETTTIPEATEAEDVGAEVTEEGTTEEAATEIVTEIVTNAEGETEIVTEIVTEKPTEGNKPTQAPVNNKKPEGKTEIVKYFNTAINAVKTNAKSVKHTKNDILIQPGSKFPSAINGILKILGGADKFIGGILEDENAKFQTKTYTGADIKKSFPVENESWASKLTDADVASASCTEANGVYTITIKTVADAPSASVKHGQGHAPKAFNVVLPGVVNENIPGIAEGMVGLASMSYPSSTVTVKVDAATGHVVSAEYKSYWTINFLDVGVVIPFLTAQSYTVAW